MVTEKYSITIINSRERIILTGMLSNWALYWCEIEGADSLNYSNLTDLNRTSQNSKLPTTFKEVFKERSRRCQPRKKCPQPDSTNLGYH